MGWSVLLIFYPNYHKIILCSGNLGGIGMSFDTKSILINREQAAKICGISVNLLDKARKSGVYPFNQFIRIGKLVKYNAQFFEKALLNDIILNDSPKSRRNS